MAFAFDRDVKNAIQFKWIYMYCVYALQMRFFDMTIAFAESFCLSSQIKIRLERNVIYFML